MDLNDPIARLAEIADRLAGTTQRLCDLGADNAQALIRIADALDILVNEAHVRPQQERVSLVATHAKLKADFYSALRIFEADQRKYDRPSAQYVGDEARQRSDRLEQRLDEAENALRTCESEHPELGEVQA